ncbi:MAG: hypothetical protein IH983_00500 [Planctomycetes bacterium]|nr:hypothetical protein [Planctomycetota bacterium]
MTVDDASSILRGLMTRFGSQISRDRQAFRMACRGCGSLKVELFLDLGEQPHCNRLIAATGSVGVSMPSAAGGRGSSGEIIFRLMAMTAVLPELRG